MTNEEMVQDLKQFITATVSQSTADIREDIAELKTDVSQLKTDVSDINLKLDTFMDAVGENQIETDKRLTRLEDKVFAS